MHNSANKIKNIEIPENLFSNLGEIRKTRIVPITEEESEPVIYKDNDIKEETNNYRERITKMYENLEDLTPVNNEIDNILYFNNYVEKGIVIKPKISSLKQFWTEYRLIRNEKTNSKIEDTTSIDLINNQTSNFDELFTALSERVTEINKYIDELKEMKSDIDESNNKLKQDTINLQEEKERFMDYKKREEDKLKEEKKSLKVNYDRLQNIINDLDKKLNEIEK